MQCRVNCYSAIVSWLGFYYLFTDQRSIFGRDKLLLKCVFFRWVLLPTFRPLQDNRGRWTAVSLAGSCFLLPDQCRIIGEDELLSPWLGLCYLLSDQCRIIGGDELLSPWLGLCYLLSDQCRIMGEMNCYSIAVSLAGSLLPAFRPLQDNRGR